MGFFFVQKFFFGQESQNIFFFLCKARNLFPEFNIRLYDKKFESDYFFFLHQNQIIFFSNIGNQNIFFLEKTITPPKLNGSSLSNLPACPETCDTLPKNIKHTQYTYTCTLKKSRLHCNVDITCVTKKMKLIFFLIQSLLFPYKNKKYN